MMINSEVIKYTKSVIKISSQVGGDGKMMKLDWGKGK
jgi:hypothetical protein